jgi:hypothetical protein
MRYGYFRIYILLRREGWVVNHKRAYRLYREDGVSLRLNGRAGTSALRGGRGSRRRSHPMRCGRWTLSRTPCSTADACVR